jgi:hypothetical protein
LEPPTQTHTKAWSPARVSLTEYKEVRSKNAIHCIPYLMTKDSSFSLLTELRTAIAEIFGPLSLELTDPKNNEKSTEAPKGDVRTVQIGIWTIYTYVADWRDNLPGWQFIVNLGILSSCLQPGRKFAKDLWQIGGTLIFTYLATAMFQAMLPSISLYYSASLFTSVCLPFPIEPCLPSTSPGRLRTL